MIRNRIILLVVSAILIAVLYFLPKSVVENDSQLQNATDQKTPTLPNSPHGATPQAIRGNINRLRARYLTTLPEEKNAIFADSLAGLYNQAGLFDSAAWFAERATTFFKTDESLLKAGNAYYEAYTFAVDAGKQKALAEKTREIFGKVLEKYPKNLEVKTKMAMTKRIARGIIRGPPLIRISKRLSFCWATVWATLARLSLIFAESIKTCRKNKFIQCPI